MYTRVCKAILSWKKRVGFSWGSVLCLHRTLHNLLADTCGGLFVSVSLGWQGT